MAIKIKVLKASNGDCLLISFKNESNELKNILIDGGIGQTYTGRQGKKGPLKLALKKIKELGESIDLLILTHIDNDHIAGIIKIFEDDELCEIIKNVWFNSGILLEEYFKSPIKEDRRIDILKLSGIETGVVQGIKLEEKLTKLNCWDKQIILAGHSDTLLGCKITVLSPNHENLLALHNNWEVEKSRKETAATAFDFATPLDDFIDQEKENELKKIKFMEDKAIPNGSSIAILLEVAKKNLLFLGDSHPSIVEENLKKLGYCSKNKLKASLVKVSHHCSKKNTSPSLLSIIECENYVVSTNQSSHGLPNKECLARIIYYQAQPLNFIFNYDLADKIFTSSEKAKYKINTIYLDDKEFVLNES